MFFYQRLTAGGVEKLPHDGQIVADLTNSSTEDYGLDVDGTNDALIAFLDTRENRFNQQVTATRLPPLGKPIWGRLGVQLTPPSDYNFHAAPKIAATSDGNVVVAWTENSNVMLQKLNAAGQPQWGSGIVFSQSGYNFSLADLHAADNGSVIVSWVSGHGFGSNSQLSANKVSASGALLWGSANVSIFNVGSLQFGNFPYFIYDGNGGAGVRVVYQHSGAAVLCAAHSCGWQRGLPAEWSGSFGERIQCESRSFGGLSRRYGGSIRLLDGRGFRIRC